MVKMSVDFPREAPRCQRILSITPQISFDPDEIADAIAGLFPAAALCDKIISAATGRSKCPPIAAKWNASRWNQPANRRIDQQNREITPGSRHNPFV
jgi:hypothetical protein